MTNSFKNTIEQEIGKIIKSKDLSELKGFHKLIISTVEKVLLTETINACNGNKSKAAKILGINRNTISKKLK